MPSVKPSPLTVEHVDINTLRPDPANPRRISDSELETLTRSIREFGLVDPIIARHDDRVVQARGGGRLESLQVLGRRPGGQRRVCVAKLT